MNNVWENYMGMRILILLTCAATFGCNADDTSAPNCWPELDDGFAAISNLAALQRLGSDKGAIYRNQLRQQLADCIDTLEFTHSAIPSEASYNYTTLLDVAIAADAPILVKQVLSNMDEKTTERIFSLNPESNDNHPLFLAAVLESAAAFSTLLEHTTDPNVTDSAGFELIHVAGGQTDSGLRLIKQLATMGNSLDAETAGGLSPLLSARNRGDIRAVQCLLLLGAKPPDSLDIPIAEPLNETIRLNQTLIDDMLIGDAYDPDPAVRSICKPAN